MNSIRNIARLNDIELQKVTPSNASWHTDYRDTAYIYIGGLPFELSEGDVLIIFSQYGNPKHINLMRDSETGKSRGFAWLKYEDQRSTDLAVDNLSGAQVLGRTLSVDHARYKMKEGERETVGDDEEDDLDETDREGEARRKRRRTSGSESEEERPMVKEEVELAKLMREHDDDDPMKAYLVEQKKAEVQEALTTLAISKPKPSHSKRKHEHRHRDHERRGKRRGSDDEDGANAYRSRKRRGGEYEDGRSTQRSSRRQRSKSDDTDPQSDDLRRKKREETHSRQRDDPDER